MKKLVLSLAILGFIAFGALSIQNLSAAAYHIEVVNFDKDPKKDGDKKAVESKEAKSAAKSSDSGCAKDCSSSCKDKSTTASADCCSKDKTASAGCCPDKK